MYPSNIFKTTLIRVDLGHGMAIHRGVNVANHIASARRALDCYGSSREDGTRRMTKR